MHSLEKRIVASAFAVVAASALLLNSLAQAQEAEAAIADPVLAPQLFGLIPGTPMQSAPPTPDVYVPWPPSIGASPIVAQPPPRIVPTPGYVQRPGYEPRSPAFGYSHGWRDWNADRGYRDRDTRGAWGYR